MNKCNSHSHSYGQQFSRYGHQCDLSEEPQGVKLMYAGNSYLIRLKRFFINAVVISEWVCKPFVIHLRSHGAIMKEVERQLTYYRCVIHPFSEFRVWWEIFMIFVILVQVITAPIDMAYCNLTNVADYINSTPWKLFRTIFNLICCLDIVINFLTGYYDKYKKEIILEHKKIFANYLKTCFVLDFISSVPTHWELILEISKKGLYYLKIFNVLKIFRLYTLVLYYKTVCQVYNVDFYIRNTTLLIALIFIYWHALSCLLLFAWSFEEVAHFPHGYRYNNITGFEIFADSMYYGALVISLSTHNTSNPRTTFGYFFASFYFYFAKLVQIYFLAQVMELIICKYSAKRKYRQFIRQLTEFMRHKQLPPYMQKRITTYYEYLCHKNYFRENEIFETVSEQLREEITMQACRQLVESVAFFRNIPLNLLVRIVSCLKSEVYLPNDVIIRVNTPGNAMYFISSGTVAVYTSSGKEVCHLQNGAHFGEIALVMKGELRVASVVAVEVCELYRLDRKDFVKAIYPYPDLIDKIQRIAADRMERTTMLDEHNRREMSGL